MNCRDTRPLRMNSKPIFLSGLKQTESASSNLTNFCLFPAEQTKDLIYTLKLPTDINVFDKRITKFCKNDLKYTSKFDPSNIAKTSSENKKK